jgi:hypothetical protein
MAGSETNNKTAEVIAAWANTKAPTFLLMVPQKNNEALTIESIN